MEKIYRVDVDSLELFDLELDQSSIKDGVPSTKTEIELAALKNALQSGKVFEDLRDKVVAEISRQNLSKSALILSLADSELDSHLKRKIQFIQRSKGGKIGGRRTAEYLTGIDFLRSMIKKMVASGIEPSKRALQDYILEHEGYDLLSIPSSRLKKVLEEHKKLEKVVC